MDILQSEFSRVGRFIDDYLQHPEHYPVLARTKPGEIVAALPENAPETGEPFDALMDDFEKTVLPGITHWNHPRFFAYFATSAAPVAIAAEAIVATLDVKAMLWRTSPAATELEAVVMRWLARLLGIDDVYTGIIYDTASIAGFTALAAAREALDLDIRRKGMIGRGLPRLRVYITEHTHSHIEKGAIALGIGQENVVKIPCDEQFQMRPDALETQIIADIAAGMKPMAVVATVGTTSMTSIDPVPQIAKIAGRYGVWLHVDAAYAGVAAIIPEFRYILDGAEAADSMVFNPHKWLFVPMDLSVLYIRDEAMLRRAFSLVPAYLETSDGDVRNYMDYGLQLGRRFRALKLWFVLRYYGANGLRDLLREHIALAAELASWIEEEPGWRVVAPHPFSVVCFRCEPHGADEAQTDERNRAIMASVNADGTAFISHTEIDGHFVLRVAIGNLRTTRDDVLAVWTKLRDAAAT